VIEDNMNLIVSEPLHSGPCVNCRFGGSTDNASACEALCHDDKTCNFWTWHDLTTPTVAQAVLPSQRYHVQTDHTGLTRERRLQPYPSFTSRAGWRWDPRAVCWQQVDRLCPRYGGKQDQVAVFEISCAGRGGICP
jgi:hypothetical protein